MSRISVIGAGGWGTAISVMLATYGHEVMLWSRFQSDIDELLRTRENKRLLKGVKIPDNVKMSSDIGIAGEAEIIVMAVPSFAVRETARALKSHLNCGQILVNIAKGLEDTTGLRLSEVIFEETGFENFVAMSGPSHAEEVARGIPTTNVVSSKYKETAQKIQDVFMNPVFRIYTSSDTIGLELGAALKNVIALCAGICDGMGYGDNTKAALMTRGITEIARLGVKMGARPETFAGLTGIGDLIVTCTSMHSRNRRAGILIGQGMSVENALKEVDMVVEGYKTAKAAHMLSLREHIEMPIVNEAYLVLYEGKDPATALSDLMTRNKKIEIEETWVDGAVW